MPISPAPRTVVAMKRIGKKILVVIAGLALLVTVGLGVAVWRARDIVTLLKPTLEEKLSAALGAPVQLGEVSLSLFPSCSVMVRDVRVRAEGRASEGPSLERLAVHLELLPLLRRELKVSSVQLDGPRVTLVRSASGITVAGLPQRGASKPSQTPPPPASPSPAPNAGESVPPALSLDLQRVALVRGEIVLHDDTQAAGPVSSPLTLREVAASASVTSEGERLRISALTAGAALTEALTLKLTGDEITFAPNTSELTLKGAALSLPAGELRAAGTVTLSTQRGAVTFSVQRLALEQLKELPGLGSSLKPYDLTGTLESDGELELRGPQKINLNAKATLAKVSATLPQKRQLQGVAGTVTIKGSPSDLTLSSEKLTGTVDTTPLEVALTAHIASQPAANPTLKLSRLTIGAFGGQTEAPFTLALRPPLHLSTTPRARALDITQLSALVQPTLAQRLSGTIQSFEGSIVGPLSGQPPNLRGRGSTTITDAVIKGVNLAQLVLASVKGIPLIEEALLARVPPEFEQLLREPDTRIQRATTTFEFSPQGVDLRTLTLKHEIFELTSNGQIAPDGDLNLRATITFSEQFSRALATRVKRLENILTPPGQLIIPLQIRGISPRLIVVPDLKGLMQTGAGKVIEREAERAIDKAFGKGSSRSNGVKDALRGLLGK